MIQHLQFHRLREPGVLVRAALIALALVCAHHLLTGTKPWETTWAERIAAGKQPTTSDRIRAITWAASWVSLALAMGLAATATWWLRLSRIDFRPILQPRIPGSPWFWTATCALVILALPARLPRMTHSFTGDEEAAFRTNVHGQFVPVDPADPLGPLVFKPAGWRETFFHDIANNHYAFTILQRLTVEAHRSLTGRPRHQFDEAVARLVPLLAGLASLPLLAWLVARAGFPVTGLLSALLLSLHPWHIRYSTEARGYSLLWVAFLLLMLAAIRFVERGRWRDAAFLAGANFLVLYTWKAALLPVVFINLGIALHVFLRRPASERSVWMVRGIVPNVLSAAAFLHLVGPNVPQLKRMLERDLMKGPMEMAWLKDSLSALATGMDYTHGRAGDLGVTLSSRLAEAPASTALTLVLLPLLAVAGFLLAWRNQRLFGILLAAPLLGAILTALRFKMMGLVHLTWYFSFLLPVAAICVAAAITGLARRLAPRSPAEPPVRSLAAGTSLAVILLIPYLRCVGPYADTLRSHPYEDNRLASLLTRPDEKARSLLHSDTISCHLWRGAPLYDPRLRFDVRNAGQLRQLVTEARARGYRLSFAVGNVGFAEVGNADLVHLLRDSGDFERIATINGCEPIVMEEIYVLKPQLQATASLGPR